MANNFFDEEQPVDQDIQDTIKLGDKEYTQDELQELVGLGNQAKDLEDRWSTKLDRLMPEYTKARQQLSDYDKKQLEQQNQPRNTTPADTSSPDDLRRQAQQQLRDLGYLPENEIDQRVTNKVQEMLAGQRLLNETEGLISQMTNDGNPKTSSEELLLFMSERGINNPQDAYDIMFKSQLREIEAKKLQSLRPSGLTTISSSNAGGKMPEPVRTTKDNLEQVLLDALRTGRG